MRIAVIGGAGAMGAITVRDLYETAGASSEILICDYNLTAAQELAASLGSRAKAVFADVRKADALSEAVAGSNVVVNCVQYQFNLNVMEAALAAKAHYVDLGGLFHVTRIQLELFERFLENDLTALIGMGAAPGITNVLSRHLADQLDTMKELHLRVGGVDNSRYDGKMALPVSYSIKTILEEFSFQPAVFTKGEIKFVEPMSGDKPHRFPPPIGVQKPMYTIHSEVATLPNSFRDKGVKEVSFKIAFDPEFLDRVKFIRDVGLASDEPVEVGGQKVAPIDLVNKVVMAQKRPKRIGKMKQYEVVRAIAKGTQGKKKVTLIADCHTTGMPAWDIGLDIDTGSPPSIVAQMLAKGELTERGVLPAEIAVPVKPFFKELKKRRMKVVVTKKSGWSFPV